MTKTKERDGKEWKGMERDGKGTGGRGLGVKDHMHPSLMLKEKVPPRAPFVNRISELSSESGKPQNKRRLRDSGTMFGNSNAKIQPGSHHFFLHWSIFSPNKLLSSS